MSKGILNSINSPSDLRKLPPHTLTELAEELRKFIIEVVASKEGHLGASLGVVELTIALHYCFNTPEDRLVWDVGHQAYGHKILTGRRDRFHTNRQLHGLSGFPKRSESIYDTFGVGHSSTAISAALGMAIGSQLNGELRRNHIAVVGDASIASGMAFEGMNHAGVTQANLLIVLNDNAIGIDPSVGALKDYLTRAKIGKKPVQDNIVEALNFQYFGPVDGHDLDGLINIFEELKTVSGPKFLHVITKKGKGLRRAEEDQVKYHAPGKFIPETGELIPSGIPEQPLKFQDVFGLTLVDLARSNSKIIGITPAMPSGSSLIHMMKEFPNRAFDVGIAEQHAVTLAAGMTTEGWIVYTVIYSTFLQRAYDQIIHDVALQDLPVVFCVDRAGLVGEDGATHHGVFDLAYLRCIPNLIIFAPLDEHELRNILFSVQTEGYLCHPIAIRYPRGRGVCTDWPSQYELVPMGKARRLSSGTTIAILSIGSIGTKVVEAMKEVSSKDLISHYSMRFLKPLDESVLHDVFKSHQYILTVEDGVIKGGLGSAVLEFMADHDYCIPVKRLGVSDQFMEHGKVEELQEMAGIDVESIKRVLQEVLQEINS